METRDMFEVYKGYIIKYKEIINVLNDLLKDKSVEGFQLSKSNTAIETCNFILDYEGHKVKGTITIREIFLFLDENNYGNDLVKDAVYELILEKAKTAFISKMNDKSKTKN